jgi:streptomycin 6-kinase
MSADEVPRTRPRVEQWGGAFQQVSPPAAIGKDLLSEARDVFDDLCRSQTNRRLLHGDLHHYNVLHDRARGWLAIDPKGVVGELEYEIGAALRNPVERPDLFVDTVIIEKRVAYFASTLAIDAGRTLRWAFAQAVLAALWSVEEGTDVDAGHPLIRLAEAMRPMLMS